MGILIENHGTAIFEYDGRLTVLPVSAKHPINPADINLTPQEEYISAEVSLFGVK